MIRRKVKKKNEFSAVQFMRQQIEGVAVPKPKAKKRMRQMSPKRQKESREYTKKRKAFLEENPICQVCGRRKSRDVHHTKKPRCRYLLAVETWMAVCRKCHDKIEDNKRWAREKGYLK